MAGPAPLTLLADRRFWPLWLSQFLAAYLDNFVLMGGALMLGMLPTAHPLAALALGTALFTLPFLLFSAWGGSLAERWEPGPLIARLRLAALAILPVLCYGVWSGSLTLVGLGLFAMGSVAALMGPVKYAALRRLLPPERVVAGTGWLVAGTFAAILLGRDSFIRFGPLATMAMPLALAILAWAASLALPRPAATAPRRGAAPAGTVATLRLLAAQPRALRLSVLGLSWFWLLGAVTVSVATSRTDLAGLLPALVGGVALGALLCDRLSGRRVEPALVPLGALGISLAGLDLALAGLAPGASPWRAPLDLALLGLSAGLYAVPLYGILLSRAPEGACGRLIAANNIVNAGFMLVGLLAAQGLGAALEDGRPVLLLVLPALNAAIAIYICTLVPEFLMRFLAWGLIGLGYRVRRRGLEHVPEDGPAVLVCNHVSYVDALIIGGSIRRPVRFVMDAGIFRVPVLNFIFRTAGTIPIASQKSDPETYERAFARIAAYLRDGELVLIFPEGRLTRDGAMGPFRPGVERILRETPAPVVPLALRGLWGSLFSWSEGRAVWKRPRRFRARIELAAGPLLPPTATAAEMEAAVRGLRGDAA
ncbi:MAG TPA: 1-acyl-sn-glycerol-3-phosphate acyltransferase [Alphaproteobacteria bacterium]|nr:1-acyl-sn-glycerol-3-phosphate acyltransferase [Alphaproteobacteria bacterium]